MEFGSSKISYFLKMVLFSVIEKHVRIFKIIMSSHILYFGIKIITIYVSPGTKRYNFNGFKQVNYLFLCRSRPFWAIFKNLGSTRNYTSQNLFSHRLYVTDLYLLAGISNPVFLTMVIGWRGEIFALVNAKLGENNLFL